ncbi:hypothetical protein PVAND_000703 [Polypedilum vanderplanki]|uniref:Phenoloxidase-activating factor 2 n=1 Tax=Polypedilum vanderplanki TaxID=319348 RepID=A0A9J6BLE3_POLVA|nr:hypothetical protein PVAND_000703 [Polypedilum vanderplanki]
MRGIFVRVASSQIKFFIRFSIVVVNGSKSHIQKKYFVISRKKKYKSTTSMLMNFVVILSLFAIAFAEEAGNLDAQINEALARGEPGAEDTPKPCNGGLGECVPYYLCKDGKINTDGSDLLDIRFNEENECVDYFEQCCETGDVLPPTNPLPPPTAPKVSTQCGFRNIEGVGFRITGNNDGESEYGEFPWMVAILKEEIAADQVLNVYQCGGSLITNQVVLTAAHCVAGKAANTLKVRAGEWDTQTKNELFPHSDHEVIDVIVHENYYKGGLHNDVALLILREPIQFAEHINAVCLPPQNFNFDGKRCFASGWGKDVFGKEGKYQAILKKIELPTVPFNKCQDSLRTTRLGKRFVLHNSFMCAGGEPGKDACKGDGGSPLVCEAPGHAGHYYQAGIVAWGIGCGENNIPGVYVDVGKFRTWIDSKIQAKGLPTTGYAI